MQQDAFSVENAPTLKLQQRNYTDCNRSERIDQLQPDRNDWNWTDPVATGREPVPTRSEPVATQTDLVATSYNPFVTERVGLFSIQNAPRCIIAKHYIYRHTHIYCLFYSQGVE